MNVAMEKKKHLRTRDVRRGFKDRLKLTSNAVVPLTT